MKQWQDLLDGWLADSLTADELEAFLALADRHESRLSEAIESMLLSRSFQGLGTEVQRARLLNQVLARRNDPVVSLDPEVEIAPIHPEVKPAPVHRMTNRNWWWAAAAILIISIGAVVVVSSDRRLNTLGTKVANNSANDILPGGNKAVLTLANGQTIILDNAVNGKLAQQGNATITKLNSGQLAYSADGKIPAEVLYNTMNTPRGGQYRLKLPDGTDVWLNSASSITYPTVFVGNERNVTISGEAYFEVAKDKTKPFHVKVNNMEVEVLGTHFNINSYDDEGAVKTTLLEGSVKVSNDRKESVVLKPSQQAVVVSSDKQPSQPAKTAGIKIVTDTDLDQVMAWKNGYFQFNRADIKTVMRQIARWYDVDVVYEGDVQGDKFIGELPMDANLSQVLRALEKIQVHFRIEEKKIIVMP